MTLVGQEIAGELPIDSVKMGSNLEEPTINKRLMYFKT